ncbi:MAG TPA: glycine oxidase ThiO [Polyangiaceae bacterium]|nr:glycine oxidase ThiO [Polyangiaceae bacterium]
MAESAPSRTRTAQVLVIGGGIMGCACSWELARRGFAVTVLEKSVPGAEASSHAAGILGAQAEAHASGPMFELSMQSLSRYPRWTKRLFEATGIDVGFRSGGVLRVAFDRASAGALARASAWQTRKGLRSERIGRARLREVEPALSRDVAGGVLFESDARVDPRLLLRALHIAAQRAGVEFRSGAYVKSVLVKGEQVRGVTLDGGVQLLAEHVVVAAGSWTTLIEGLPLRAGSVRPARGQIVELASPAPLLSRVVYGPRCYLVPRDDGRTLVGSTLEFVGYRREVTAAAVRDLLSAAIELVPSLAEASVNSAWSSFRPYTDDELPLLGPAGIAGLTLATGHYRNGILLAPITAEITAALLRGTRPPVSLAAFSPQRAGAAR